MGWMPVMAWHALPAVLLCLLECFGCVHGCDVSSSLFHWHAPRQACMLACFASPLHAAAW
jgi:hypothetical protein